MLLVLHMKGRCNELIMTRNVWRLKLPKLPFMGLKKEVWYPIYVFTIWP